MEMRLTMVMMIVAILMMVFRFVKSLEEKPADVPMNGFVLVTLCLTARMLF